ERNRENTRPWRRALCDTCPVPGILRNTTCKHLALEGSVQRKLFVTDRVEVYAVCTEHIAELTDPHRCPQCEAESRP
ncbi:MAG: hypothetical protein MUC34_08390, partial [Anaerolineae bacterium]|nr:hypothetical protein [Anaerolineae bacterium]